MIILGTMTWGRETDKEEARNMYAVARAHGIDTFDTARIYSNGLAEEWLGEFTRGSDVKVNTKIGYHGVNLIHEYTESLKALKRLPYTIFHHHWMKHGSEQAAETLYEICLVGARFGISNCAAWQLVQVDNWVGVDACQFLYNLYKRQAEVEIIPACKDLHIEMQGYSPLASGLLTGKYGALEQDSRWRLNADSRYRHRYQSVLDAKLSLDVTPALALAWSARNGVNPIIGCRTASQLENNLLAYDRGVNEKALDKWFPPPPPATDRSEER